MLIKAFWLTNPSPSKSKPQSQRNGNTTLQIEFKILNQAFGIWKKENPEGEIQKLRTEMGKRTTKKKKKKEETKQKLSTQLTELRKETGKKST